MLLNDPPRNVQLLTHPENWQDDRIDRETLLTRLLQSSQEDQAVIPQDLKKFWFEDPVIREYDYAIKSKYSGASNPKFGNILEKV